jgi:hypothetical protein
MTTEAKSKIAKILAFIVSISGILVILGWIFDVSLLKSLSPAWISMKFDAALAFVFSGLILYFIAQTREGDSDAAPVVLPIASLVILLLIGTLLFGNLLGVRTGAEELFIRDTSSVPTTATPGMPSLPTMVNFLLIASAAILALFNPEKLTAMLKNIGLTVGSVGGIAVLGYLINIPLLYYFIAGVNNAMACHTAILFVFLGAGFLCL